MFLGFRVLEVKGLRLGTASTCLHLHPPRIYIRLLLGAIYNYHIDILQLLKGGGSTQG